MANFGLRGMMVTQDYHQLTDMVYSPPLQEGGEFQEKKFMDALKIS